VLWSQRMPEFVQNTYPKTSAADYFQHFLGNLKGCGLFAHLPRTDLSRLWQAARLKSYKKGQVLYLQGDTAACFYVIHCGWIKLFHSLPDGEEVIIDMLTTGHMAGEDAIFENSPHTSSAESVEDCQLLCIPSHILKDHLHQNPTLALGMLSAMYQHHRDHYDQIAQHALQSAPQRIADFLLKLCPKDKIQNIAFDLPYDKTLIAYTLGMNGATFSRALNILRDRTGIRIRGMHVEIDTTRPLLDLVYGPGAEFGMAREL
jgi:CRP/FNR family transcriptional regulator, dissimilatory nitrate respiration regulator